MKDLSKTKKYMLCEAPVCIGAPTVGMEKAYACLKEAFLQSLFEKNAVFADFEEERELPEILCDKRLIGYETVMNVSRFIRKSFLSAFEKGLTPITVGGDHSVVMGSLAALGEHFGCENTALIYIDGHTDINTEKTSLSGRIHGMPLAAAMGLCTPLLDVGKNRKNLLGKNTFIIGAHSIDPEEWGIMDREGVTLYSPHDVHRFGYETIIKNVLKKTEGKKVHVSFDVDAIDGSEFFATGYAMPGGMSFDTVYNMLKMIVSEKIAVSYDIVEYNPSRDKNGICLSMLEKVFRLFV